MHQRKVRHVLGSVLLVVMAVVCCSYEYACVHTRSQSISTCSHAGGAAPKGDQKGGKPHEAKRDDSKTKDAPVAEVKKAVSAYASIPTSVVLAHAFHCVAYKPDSRTIAVIAFVAHHPLLLTVYLLYCN